MMQSQDRTGESGKRKDSKYLQSIIHNAAAEAAMQLKLKSGQKTRNLRLGKMEKKAKLEQASRGHKRINVKFANDCANCKAFVSLFIRSLRIQL
mmetsp:Transcript_1487/g.3358  ORF Transcript_1487/g.3358 Transcript_1487/m.3358 type:complete len:94 (+) Transcript_1487:1628-1909(+)